MFPTRKDGLKSTLLPDGHLVVVDESSNIAVTLTPLAAAVWEFCDGQHTSTQITNEIQELMPSPIPTLQDDIEALLAELSQGALICLHDNSTRNCHVADRHGI